jgi:hypothetical protein
MKTKQALIILAASAVLLVVLLTTHSSNKPYSVALVDVSWPNCKLAPSNVFGNGIIGVSGGLDFSRNPCLSQETGWFVNYALYVNTGYPGVDSHKKFPSAPKLCRASDKSYKQCLAYNYGYNATKYAITYANLSNAHATQWWLDVETENSWTNSPLVNRASLQGAIDAIRQNVLFARVGIYSSPNQWNLLTGKWHNGLPAWLATGGTSRAAALSACQDKSFTAGPLQLTQYTPNLDQNLICSPTFTSPPTAKYI